MRQSLNDNATQQTSDPLLKPANWIIRGAFLSLCRSYVRFMRKICT